MSQAKFNALAAKEALRIISESVVEWKRTCELEETKREAIRAERDIIITRIQSQKDCLIEYFRLSFAERALVLNSFFVKLDKAVDCGSIEMATVALNGIVAQIQINPLNGLSKFQNALESKEPLDI